VATVSSLAVTPVKGLGLLSREEVLLDEHGIVHNRRFFLADHRGFLISVFDAPELVRVRPRYDPEREWLRLEFPDGSSVEGSTATTGDQVEADFHTRRVRGHFVDGPFDEAVSRYAGREIRLIRPLIPGDAADVEPLTLLSDASVEELARRAGRVEPLDGRRFRIQIHLAGCEPHEEDTWDGRLLRLGESVVRVGGPIPRCRATTRNPDTGEKDFDTLKAIAAYRGTREGKHIDFGVYAQIETPGRVRVGDTAELV
jgi:uncharacterized protein YcbX